MYLIQPERVLGLAKKLKEQIKSLEFTLRFNHGLLRRQHPPIFFNLCREVCQSASIESTQELTLYMDSPRRLDGFLPYMTVLASEVMSLFNTCSRFTHLTTFQLVIDSPTNLHVEKHAWDFITRLPELESLTIAFSSIPGRNGEHETLGRTEDACLEVGRSLAGMKNMKHLCLQNVGWTCLSWILIPWTFSLESLNLISNREFCLGDAFIFAHRFKKTLKRLRIDGPSSEPRADRYDWYEANYPTIQIGEDISEVPEDYGREFESLKVFEIRATRITQGTLRVISCIPNLSEFHLNIDTFRHAAKKMTRTLNAHQGAWPSLRCLVIYKPQCSDLSTKVMTILKNRIKKVEFRSVREDSVMTLQRKFTLFE